MWWENGFLAFKAPSLSSIAQSSNELIMSPQSFKLEHVLMLARDLVQNPLDLSLQVYCKEWLPRITNCTSWTLVATNKRNDFQEASFNFTLSTTRCKCQDSGFPLNIGTPKICGVKLERGSPCLIPSSTWKEPLILIIDSNREFCWVQYSIDPREKSWVNARNLKNIYNNSSI